MGSTCGDVLWERPPYDVAVDVHQERWAVLAQDRDGKERWRCRLPASAAGEEALLERLRPGDRVVLEATRGSHRLAEAWEASGATLIIVDAGQARLIGHNGKKTDFRDCAALLKHLRSGDYAEVWRPDPETRKIRFLAGERLSFNQSITRLKNRVRALLHEEGLRYPGELLWGTEGVVWLAQQQLPEGTLGILLRSWKALQALQELKAEAEREALAAVALEREEVVRLMQIVGFGMTIAVLFVGQVGNVHRFGSAKKLVSYAGLNPRVRQSDRYTQHGQISKAGRQVLRWLLVEAAWTHVRMNGPLAHVYHRLVERGKATGTAIVALARRLLVLAYALLREQAAYRELAPATYERKLAELAGRRPGTEEPQDSNLDWAAGRFKAVTGEESPYRQRQPQARLRRPRGPGGYQRKCGAAELTGSALPVPG